MTGQKLWLIDRRDRNPDSKHNKLAQELKDKFRGNLLSSSTVSDWLKRSKILVKISEDVVSYVHVELEKTSLLNLYRKRLILY